MSFHARPADRVRFDDQIAVLAAFLDVPLVQLSLRRADRRFLTNRIAPAGWPSEATTNLERLLEERAERGADPLIVRQAVDHPVLSGSELVTRFGLCALAAVPLLSREDECLGWIGVGDLQQRSWSRPEIDLLETMAAAIATTLELQREREGRLRVEEELVEARRAARAHDERRDGFLMALSHEMRTPLNSVIRFTDLILRGQLNDRQSELVGRVRSNTRNLLDLVNDLLQLTRVQSGAIALESREVDVAELTRTTVRKLTPGRADASVRIRTEVPEGGALMQTDPVRLTQIVSNIVAHSLRFTRQGEVKVALHTDRASGRPTSLQVRDTGPGLADPQRRMVFEPFEQAAPDSRQRQQGSALGLTLARSLAELMGYPLQVESALGEGTIFTLEFPQQPRGAAGPEAMGRELEGEEEA